MREKNPQVVVVGAPKCGTTSLYHYFSQHPSIYVPSKKELHFFSRDFIKQRMNGPGDSFALDGCPETSEQYAKLYEEAGEDQVTVDVSPSYFSNPECFQLIKAFNPDVKVIVILRNPIEKAFSHFMHLVRESRESIGFTQALDLEAERKAQGYSDFWMYAESGLFCQTVQNAFDVFGRDNCLILFQEDLKADAVSTMSKIYEFIGVEYFAMDVEKVFNRSGVPKSKLISSMISPGPFLRFAKMLIPAGIGSRLKSFVQDMNTGEKISMTASERERLRLYYLNDVKSLGLLLNSDIPWSDFRGEVK